MTEPASSTAPRPTACPPATPPRPPSDRAPLDLARRIVELAEDKKAADIVLLDLGELTTVADAFVICSGGSERQISAIADGIVAGPARRGRQADRPRGHARIALGPARLTASVIVHVFTPPERDYYQLERHWSGAKTVLRVQ